MKAKIIKDCVFPKGIKQDDFDLWYKTNDNISWIENAMEAYSEHRNKELIEYIKDTRKDKPLSAYGEGYADAINDVEAILNNKTNDKNE